jgi:DNA-binding phage protein
MNTTQTLPWDVTEHLQTQEDIAAYLEAALEEGDPELIIVALKDIARCQKMKQIIKQNRHWYRLVGGCKRCNTRGSTKQANLE